MRPRASVARLRLEDRMVLTSVVAAGGPSRCSKHDVNETSLRGRVLTVSAARWQYTTTDVHITPHLIHVPRSVWITADEREHVGSTATRCLRMLTHHHKVLDDANTSSQRA